MRTFCLVSILVNGLHPSPFLVLICVRQAVYPLPVIKGRSENILIDSSLKYSRSVPRPGASLIRTCLFVPSSTVNMAGPANRFQVWESESCCLKYDTVILRGRESDMGGWMLGGKSIIILSSWRRKNAKTVALPRERLVSIHLAAVSLSLSLRLD